LEHVTRLEVTINEYNDLTVEFHMKRTSEEWIVRRDHCTRVIFKARTVLL
jgi:hypothetical protein